MNDIDHARELLKLARADLKALTGVGDPEIFTDAISKKPLLESGFFVVAGC